VIFSFIAGHFGIACDFTGKYAPYQAVQIGPHPHGGAYLCATDEGRTAFFAHDRGGVAPVTTCFLPDKDLSKAARFIRTAERTLEINTATNVATVTTHQKAADKVVELRAPLVTQQFPPLLEMLGKCSQQWNVKPRLSPHSGCYDPTLLRLAMDACSSLNTIRTGNQPGDRVIVSATDGGPALLEVPGVRAAVVVMPHNASALTGTPDWLAALASQVSDSSAS
jgi:hypothetical protein